MNPGTQKLLETHQAFVKGTDLPKWTRYLVGHGELGLTYDEKNLYFEGKPLATDEVKRKRVKDLCFNPKEPSTIQPITDLLYKHFANISKINVRRILRSRFPGWVRYC